MRTRVNTLSRARGTRAQIMMTPITFKEDASDNPNKGLGILKGCGLAGRVWAFVCLLLRSAIPAQLKWCAVHDITKHQVL